MRYERLWREQEIPTTFGRVLISESEVRRSLSVESLVFSIDYGTLFTGIGACSP